MGNADDIATLRERADAAHKTAFDAERAVEDAVNTYRKENPAPAGQYWVERHGRMRLCDVPDRCTYAQDECSEGCGAEAVGADDKGNAWCEEHRQGER